MSKILNVFVFSLLLLFVACNQEDTETLQDQETFEVINLTVDTYSLEEFNAGIENVASAREDKDKTTVFFNTNGEMIGTTGPTTDLIVVCYGAPASSPDAQCIGIHGTSSCSDVPCGEGDAPNDDNCHCYVIN